MTLNWAAILRKKSDHKSDLSGDVDSLFYSIFRNLRLALFIATAYFGNIKYQYESSVGKGRLQMSFIRTSVKPLTCPTPSILLSKLKKNGFDGWS